MNDHEFKCRRCGHDPSTKSNLLKHLRRKIPCDETYDKIDPNLYIEELLYKGYNDKTYDCEYCDMKFNSRSNKSRHKKTCPKARDAKEKASSNAIIEKLNVLAQQNETLIQNNTILSQRLLEVENILTDVNTSNKTINTTNNTINANIININLNNYGQENVSYLSHEFLSYCLLNPRKGMKSLIENIHYNSEYPENHNLRCKSLKQNIFEKYVDSEWRTCDASNSLDELIRKGYRILNTHYTDNFLNDPEIMDDEVKQQAYERFRFLTNTTSVDYFAVKREIRLLIKDRTMYLIASPEPIETQALTVQE